MNRFDLVKRTGKPHIDAQFRVTAPFANSVVTWQEIKRTQYWAFVQKMNRKSQA